MTTKNNKIKTIIEVIVFLGLLFLTFYLLQNIGYFVKEKPKSIQGKTIMLLGIFVMFFVSLGVHELGHLITGLVQGFQFQLFVVGPLGIKREADGIKVYFNKNLGLYGGVAATSPVKDDPDNPLKFARLIVAGPLSSLLFAIFFTGLSLLLGSPFDIIFYAGGLMSLGIFFATTIPSKTGMFFSDRKRYQRLTTPGKDQEVEVAMLRVMGQYALDNSYKNVSQKDIEIMVMDDMPFVRFFGLFNLICYHLEMNGEADSAVEEKYTEVARLMPSNLVKGMNAEIDRFRAQV